MNLANAVHVHAAIVAGNVGYERRNHRLLTPFVGTGEVRRHFGMEPYDNESGLNTIYLGVFIAYITFRALKEKGRLFQTLSLRTP